MQFRVTDLDACASSKSLNTLANLALANRP